MYWFFILYSFISPLCNTESLGILVAIYIKINIQVQFKVKIHFFSPFYVLAGHVAGGHCMSVLLFAMIHGESTLYTYALKPTTLYIERL